MSNRTIKTCSIDDCSKAIWSREMCSMHYQRWWKKRNQDIANSGCVDEYREAISSNSETLGECRVWTGEVNGRGYGFLYVNKRVRTAHRLAFEVSFGTIPKGMMVDHICHNRLCVEPRHLRLATNSQNMANRPGAQADSKSGIRNVVWDKRRKKWCVQVKKHGKLRSFGAYDDIEEAALVAEEARQELFGEFAGRG